MEPSGHIRPSAPHPDPKTEPDNRQGRRHGYAKYSLEDAEYFTPDTETLGDKFSFPDAELAENPNATRSAPLFENVPVDTDPPNPEP